jgi:succinate-semialdehyde dehydrogenase / glutarate-semialdehyde dehydrogenase
MSTVTSINPYSGEINATYETIDNETLESKIKTAHQAYELWKQTTFAERKNLFYKLADIIDTKIDELARLQTIEMGMLIGPSKKGMSGTSSLIRWFADNAESILWPIEFDQYGTKGRTLHDPLGVIYGVGPWNFPFNQVLRAAVPNILAGNTTIYKHASNVPMCGQAIEDLFIEAGFPIGIYQNLFISSSQSEYILAHPFVRGTNLTGSEKAGAAIGSLAGKYLKPSVLELGGNDAFVVLDHTDTQKMVIEATNCRLSNGGQRCNASKRFIVLEKYYDTFVAEMGKYMASLAWGDPMDPTTQIPPLARPDLVGEIHTQVTKSISEWARLVTGGQVLGDRGQFYAGTVLADVTSVMTCYNEETFGPVASVIKSKSVEESIKIANDSNFGLSAVVYGDDINQCKEVATKLEGGMIFINQPAGSKAHLPFGGVKNSWYGKENGPEGLKAFTNKKVIVY